MNILNLGELVLNVLVVVLVFLEPLLDEHHVVVRLFLHVLDGLSDLCQGLLDYFGDCFVHLFESVVGVLPEGFGFSFEGFEFFWNYLLHLFKNLPMFYQLLILTLADLGDRGQFGLKVVLVFLLLFKLRIQFLQGCFDDVYFLSDFNLDFS